MRLKHLSQPELAALYSRLNPGTFDHLGAPPEKWTAATLLQEIRTILNPDRAADRQEAMRRDDDLYRAWVEGRHD